MERCWLSCREQPTIRWGIVISRNGHRKPQIPQADATDATCRGWNEADARSKLDSREGSKRGAQRVAAHTITEILGKQELGPWRTRRGQPDLNSAGGQRMGGGGEDRRAEMDVEVEGGRRDEGTSRARKKVTENGLRER